jgi:uncharacterized protein YrrD
MLYSADALRSYDLRSTEGVLGRIEDFYFDERFWAVRYLVVESDGWLVQRRALVSPRAVIAVDIHSDTIATKLTKAQIAASPAPDEHAPVSRQFEIAYNEFYEYSPYWIGPLAWGAHSAPRPPEDAAPLEERESWDSHLYSARDLTGFTRYRVAAKDGHVGHVADLILSDGDWVIRYLVVNTRGWLPGKHVLVPPQWTKVSWEDATLTLELSREAIKSAPAYEEGVLIDRDYEAKLFAHYCQQAYWSDDAVCYDPHGTDTSGR